jgi:hypothetical protein
MENLQEREESEAVVSDIVDNLLDTAHSAISDKFYKLKCVALYYEIFVKALHDILDVCDKQKPCNDFSDVIEAWKRDKAAIPSVSDTLNSPKFILEEKTQQ